MRTLKPALAAIAVALMASPAMAQVPRNPDGHADLTGIWTNASLTLGGTHPTALGELAIAFKSRGNELAGALTNSGGELALNGTVLIGPQRTSLDVALNPRPNAPPAIAQLLATLGRSDPQGTVRVSWQGASLVPAGAR